MVLSNIPTFHPLKSERRRHIGERPNLHSQGLSRLGNIGVECDLCLAPAGDWGTESGGGLGSEPSLCLPAPCVPWPEWLWPCLCATSHQAPGWPGPVASGLRVNSRGQVRGASQIVVRAYVRSGKPSLTVWMSGPGSAPVRPPPPKL